MHTLFLVSLLASSALAVPATSRNKRSDAVLLSNVKTLTLYGGQQTSARRVEPIEQLTCVGGNAKDLYNVDVMRCTNAGAEYDTEDIQWTCKASLPPEVKLGGTEVVCEGYDSPDDPYILKGSCGVEYRLVLTEMGEEKYAAARKQPQYDQVYRPSGGVGEPLGAVTKFLFWCLFIGVACIVVYTIFFPNRDNRVGFHNGYHQGYNGGGGGGGDDDGGSDDPPPPYTPRAIKPASSPRAKSSTSKASSSRSTQGAGTAHGQRNDGTWRPGFWTGTAAGAAAGYAASALGGRNANRSQASTSEQTRRTTYDPPQPGPSNTFFGRTRDPTPPREPTPPIRERDTGSGWGSFFGGGAGGASNYGSGSSNYGSRPSYGGGASSYGRGSSSYGGGSSSQPSSSSPAPSSSRYESTGFGGTRRR